MRYFGGKTRTCKEISSILNQNISKVFVSPFVGGAWVESLIRNDVEKHCFDKHKYLIAMYQELQKGWMPPENLTKEEYEYIKNNKDENPYLTGFVGFGCSFAGKWFGGYAKDKTERNFCLNARNSILRKMKGLQKTNFQQKDYKDVYFENAVIYCDPPYCETSQYDKKLIGDFDSNVFWEFMRKWSLNNLVFISEYNAPKDFKIIWEKSVKLDIRDKENKKKQRVEKVFVHENLKKDIIMRKQWNLEDII